MRHDGRADSLPHFITCHGTIPVPTSWQTTSGTHRRHPACGRRARPERGCAGGMEWSPCRRRVQLAVSPGYSVSVWRTEPVQRFPVVKLVYNPRTNRFQPSCAIQLRSIISISSIIGKTIRIIAKIAITTIITIRSYYNKDPINLICCLLQTIRSNLCKIMRFWNNKDHYIPT